jgi:hypothetical protein
MSNHMLPSNGHPTAAYSLLRYLFTGLLPRNGCPSIVGCVLVGMCLPIRFLEMVQPVTIYFCDKITLSTSCGYWHSQTSYIFNDSD